MTDEIVNTDTGEVMAIQKAGAVNVTPTKPNDFHEEIKELIPTAGTLILTPEQKEILYAPIADADVEIRPDGLIYLPWMGYGDRLRRAFGMEWAIIQQGSPQAQGKYVIQPFWLIVQGKLC